MTKRWVTSLRPETDKNFEAGPISCGLRGATKARTATAASINDYKKINSLLRSKISAVALAGKPSKRVGRLAALCMRAMSNGDGVNVVINHGPAVPCIHPPRFETTEASRRSRNKESRSGPHTDFFLSVIKVLCARPVMILHFRGRGIRRFDRLTHVYFFRYPAARALSSGLSD